MTEINKTKLKIGEKCRDLSHLEDRDKHLCPNALLLLIGRTPRLISQKLKNQKI